MLDVNPIQSQRTTNSLLALQAVLWSITAIEETQFCEACKNQGVKYTKTTLAVCLALSLSACGGGSSPEPTPPAPPQADIQFNFPTSIEIARGGDASFAVSLMQNNNNAPSLFELEIVMENGSGIEVVNIAPKDSSGRRLVTLRATDKANLGIVRGTISARIGDLVKNLPIMVSIKPAVSGLYNSSFGSNGLAALPIPSGAISNAASDITFDTRGRVLALGYTQLSRGTDIAFTISRFSESG
ncbi:hypothetical protein [Deinococcus sp. LM3]|uniref:hypothetical protein n=1 Tax=Deinococcus sp. LM3 TaxID=1938608 RepID=UPI00118075D6|nr:hypothetical protein [Deinococcus sp. LM3]